MSNITVAAYILAADTSKLAESIHAYYHLVSKIIVSCDCNSLGWTGAKIRVNDVIEIIQSIDIDKKCIVVSGDYSTPNIRSNPMIGDTQQRNDALAAASKFGDWVLQIDADEVIQDVETFFYWLSYAHVHDYAALDWPMAVMFRKLDSRRYLRVSGKSQPVIYEYPGTVAVRSNALLVSSRRTTGKLLRIAVCGDRESLWLNDECSKDETRMFELNHDQVIIHYSWSRSPTEVWEKVRSWGHNDGVKSILYFGFVWLLSPLTYRVLRNIHPMCGRWWPKISVWRLDN
jgi:hypothetical protein